MLAVGVAQKPPISAIAAKPPQQQITVSTAAANTCSTTPVVTSSNPSAPSFSLNLPSSSTSPVVKPTLTLPILGIIPPLNGGKPLVLGSARRNSLHKDMSPRVDTPIRIISFGECGTNSPAVMQRI